MVPFELKGVNVKARLRLDTERLWDAYLIPDFVVLPFVVRMHSIIWYHKKCNTAMAQYYQKRCCCTMEVPALMALSPSRPVLQISKKKPSFFRVYIIGDYATRAGYETVRIIRESPWHLWQSGILTLRNADGEKNFISIQGGCGRSSCILIEDAYVTTRGTSSRRSDSPCMGELPFVDWMPPRM